MPDIAPIVIMLLVLSRVLIPLMITVVHQATGATQRIERSHTTILRAPGSDVAATVRTYQANNVVRMDDRRELA